jgi:predicted nucleic acid-binding protein
MSQQFTRPEGRSFVRRYADWLVHQITVLDIIEACELEEGRTLSFWDALVVVAAKNVGATTLLTEDLQHGQTLLGVRIENPCRA